MSGSGTNFVPSSPAHAREIDRVLEEQAAQTGRAVALLRRLEDLGDRVLGSAPDMAASDRAPTPVPSGTFSAIVDQHHQRELVLDRIEGAIARIEKVL